MPKPVRHPNKEIFINCPFDRRYQPMFEAILFAVVDCGFNPRCALELSDGGQVRIDKILKLIQECRFGIHDISRTGLTGPKRLPRFNMPFELGLFLGAKAYGRGQNASKASLILDREPHRYQNFLSDIAGQDIEAHGERPLQAIAKVRNWLQSATQSIPWAVPGGKVIGERYERFRLDKPQLCREAGLSIRDLTFLDSRWLIKGWLAATAPGVAAEKGR